MSSSGSGTVINYGSGWGSDFLTSYGSGYGSGSTSQKVTVPTVPVPVPQHCSWCHCQRVDTGMLFTTYHLLVMSFVNGSTPGCSSPHTIYSWYHCQRFNTGMPFTTNHLLMMSLSMGRYRDALHYIYHLLMMSLSRGQYRDALHHIPFTHDVIVNGSTPGCPLPQTIYSWCHCQRVNTGMQMPFTTNNLLMMSFVNGLFTINHLLMMLL